MAYLLTPARLLALPAMLALATSPALAEGKKDRAQEAVAAARAKVEIAAKLGATGEVPRLQASASAALRTAEEDLRRNHKDLAIADANHAQQLAEEAIGTTQQRQAGAADAQIGAAAATTAAAQQDAAAAQAQAAEANARADAAQRAAASAQADAAAARAAPPVVVAQPAEATVTTETTTTAPSVAPRRTVRRVVHRTTHRPVARAATSTKVTTTVKTQ